MKCPNKVKCLTKVNDQSRQNAHKGEMPTKTKCPPIVKDPTKNSRGDCIPSKVEKSIQSYTVHLKLKSPKKNQRTIVCFLNLCTPYGHNFGFRTKS